MRRKILALTLGALLLASCDQPANNSSLPTAPFTGPQANATCPGPQDAQGAIRSLYPVGPGLTSALAAYTILQDQLKPKGSITAAQNSAILLLQATLNLYYAGGTIGGKNTTSAGRVVNLATILFCQVGLPAPTITVPSLGDDGVVGVVGPTSPATTLVTTTKFAGLTVPAAAAPTLTIISVQRLPDFPGPLLTPLDQYPAFYEFTASPPVAFTQDLLVGACQVQDFTPPDFGRLKLAHNVGTAAVLLDRQTAPFLDCTGLIGMAPDFTGLRGYAQRGWHWAGPLVRDLFLPRPAYATMLGTCCLGGKTKSFSPFGAVDTLTILDAGTMNTISGTPGSSVPAGSLPRVTLLTPTLKPIAGVTVTFSVPAGSQGTITGAIQVTDASGRATLGGWTLGASLGRDSVIATATPITGTAVQSNGRLFVAVVQ